MGGLRRVDKACKKCGAMMYQVPSKRLYHVKDGRKT